MKRSEQQLENTWKIEDIFLTEDYFYQAIEQVSTTSLNLTHYENKLNNATELFDFLTHKFKMLQLLEDIQDYAYLQSDQDGSNAYFQNMKGQVDSLSTLVESRLSFEKNEILQLDFQELLKQNPKLDIYKRYINDIIRKKEHILDPKQEKLLAMAQQILHTPERIYHIFNDTDMKFNSILDQHGNIHPLTTGTFIDYMTSNDRILRKNAFQEYYRSYKNMENTAAALLDAQCKQLKFSADVRGYTSSLQASLDETQVPVEVYHNLIQTVHEDIHTLHKYMKLRKKHLKLDKLHMYDLYTSLIPDCDKDVSFEKAKKDVSRSIEIYGKEYADIYRSGLESRWIDVYENEGKRSGAYSNGCNIHPFVLLNHTPTLHSEFTLAHEMGHAMHSYLSNKYQPYCDSKYKIFVAEVASTCNEAILMNMLRNETDNPKEKAYLINYFLEQFRTTLFRQCMFAEFEFIINEKINKNETLTAPMINQIYHDLNAFYYGDDCIIDEEINVEWARIPHFYFDFYVFQYATGFSAAMAASEKILHGSQEDRNNYLQFLKGGCSKSPIELLKIAGIDMSTPKPIHQALTLFDQLIDELENLLSK